MPLQVLRLLRPPTLPISSGCTRHLSSSHNKGGNVSTLSAMICSHTHPPHPHRRPRPSPSPSFQSPLLSQHGQTYNRLRNYLQARAMTSGSGGQSLISPDFLLSSPYPDMEIPTDVAVHQYMFEKFDTFGDATAVKDFLSGQTYTYRELITVSMKVASGLHRAGLRKGDVLLCVSTNHPDLVPLMLACSSIGVIYSTANPSFTAGELARQMQDCEAVTIATIPQLANTVNQALENTKFPNKIKSKYVFGESSGFIPFSHLKDDDGLEFPDVSITAHDDVFLLPYSSGTTGLPKGVMLTHSNIISNCYQAEPVEAILPGEKVIGLLPMYHIYGKTCVQYGTLLAGGQVVTVPLFEPDMFLKCLQDEQINVAHLVPPLISFMAKDPRVSSYGLTSLRQVICAAAPLSKELTEEFLSSVSHGVSFSQGYGMTELSPAACYDAGAERPGSVGRMIANTYGKFVDVETGKTVGPHQPGHFYVKGPQVMKGYWNNQAATGETIAPDGWLATGDLGYYTEDGTVYIEDRLKELIKYKGSQVAPAELEAILMSHAHIRDAAVIGVPDERAGEVPRAFIVRKDGGEALTEKEVMDFVSENVSSHKKLRGGVEFVSEIPRISSGKILRRAIKEKYLGGKKK